MFIGFKKIVILTFILTVILTKFIFKGYFGPKFNLEIDPIRIKLLITVTDDKKSMKADLFQELDHINNQIGLD